MFYHWNWGDLYKPSHEPQSQGELQCDLRDTFTTSLNFIKSSALSMFALNFSLKNSGDFHALHISEGSTSSE